jgi:hypothetical protein
MRTITIEECLELMAGFSTQNIQPNFIILDRDKQILIDIAKKVYKGLALTDRQYEVVKKIFITRYKTQFKNRDIDIENSVNSLRQPIRYLDRSEYIKIEQGKDFVDPIWSGFTPAKVIAVRFPFNMTYSKIIADIKKTEYDLSRFYSQRIKDIYILPYTEKIIYKLISKFKNKIKDIDKTLLEVYEQCELIAKKPENFVPGIYNFEIKHSSENVVQYYKDLFGTPVHENLFLYYDRREKMGLVNFNDRDIENSQKNLSVLSKKVLMRKWPRINLDLKKWPLEQIMECVIELRRFPLLVVLPGQTEKECLESLHQQHSLFKNIVANNDVSVLTRMKNTNNFGKEFNEYIKNNNLNNSLAKSTKIVYITSKKIPKPLLISDWTPEAVLICDNTRNYSKVDSYVGSIDLQLQINGQDSFWNQINFGGENI